ncbi:MAG: DUF6596 domain-containing protein [Gemmatimonas sp.]
MSDHLFRHESGRMVAALTRIFGVHNLPLAEDVVQHAFLRAFEVWKLRGVPENPSAWLMATAKHRALDIVRNERTARTFAPELGRLLDSEWTMAPVVQEAFSAHTIRDEQLRMMFSCCHPQLPEEAQVALMLNILCGFGADEIAGAFLVKRSAMEKRITRGKKVLATSKRLFDLGDGDFVPRLNAVRRGLYLLFNEGYHGSSARVAVRSELCFEAMRLVGMLMDHAPSNTAETKALAALMCLNASRLPARVSDSGEMTTLADQDRSLWDKSLIAQGVALLETASVGAMFSTYHLEAAIAAIHSHASSIADTKWDVIVMLYDRLVSLTPSPVVSLNRAIAIGERDGAAAGLEAMRAIDDRERLNAYPFFFAAMGEFELRMGNSDAARAQFEEAVRVARNATERRFLNKKLERVR